MAGSKGDTMKPSRFTNLRKQLGQGMTEYIVIVALIAIAAIAGYALFGQTIRGQVGNMAAEVGGGSGDTESTKASGEAAKAEGATDRRLGSYTGQNEGGEE